MPRGGKREGAGRKPKAKILLVPAASGPGPLSRAAATLGEDYTALDLLRAIYRNPEAPDDVRFMAAVKAAPFETAKPTANKSAGPQSFTFHFGRAHAKPA